MIYVAKKTKHVGNNKYDIIDIKQINDDMFVADLYTVDTNPKYFIENNWFNRERSTATATKVKTVSKKYKYWCSNQSPNAVKYIDTRGYSIIDTTRTFNDIDSAAKYALQLDIKDFERFLLR